MNNSDKHHIEFLETREDAAETFEFTKQAFDFIAALVHLPIIFPGVGAITLGWNHGYKAKLKRQLTGFIPFVSPVHQKIQRAAERTELADWDDSDSMIKAYETRIKKLETDRTVLVEKSGQSLRPIYRT